MKLVLISFLSLIILSCGRVENSSSQDKALYGPRAGGSPQYEAAISIISAKCAECHASWTAYTDSDYVSTGLVVPNDPANSKVYYRNQLAAGPSNNMPSGGRPAVTTEELQTLTDWINSITP